MAKKTTEQAANALKEIMAGLNEGVIMGHRVTSKRKRKPSVAGRSRQGAGINNLKGIRL